MDGVEPQITAELNNMDLNNLNHLLQILTKKKEVLEMVAVASVFSLSCAGVQLSQSTEIMCGCVCVCLTNSLYVGGVSVCLTNLCFRFFTSSAGCNCMWVRSKRSSQVALRSKL